MELVDLPPPKKAKKSASSYNVLTSHKTVIELSQPNLSRNGLWFKCQKLEALVSTLPYLLPAPRCNTFKHQLRVLLESISSPLKFSFEMPLLFTICNFNLEKQLLLCSISLKFQGYTRHNEVVHTKLDY